MSANKVVNPIGVWKTVSMGSNTAKAVIRAEMGKIVFESEAALAIGYLADGTYYADGAIFADGGV